MAVIEIGDEGKEKKKRRFDQRDWDYVAEFVIEEYEKRKQARSDREKCWADIDRQIAMEPDNSFKYIIKNGTKVLDPNKHWMAETELPLQAQALEVLTADARRMEFPDSGPWFRAHAEMTDEYLSNIDYQSLILGDELEVPSQINQDNADKLVEGFLLHIFDQPFNDEDFFTRYDRINAEAFKYGVGVGRARLINKSLYMNTPRGVRKEVRKIPTLIPVSIKNLYLDEPMPSMHSAQLLEPAHIARDRIKLANLQMAANRGANDPEDPDGGWMPRNVGQLVGDDDGYVTLLEMEGDIVVPRKTTRSVVIPGAIVTVAMGGKDTGGKVTNAVIRFRYRNSQASSYLLHPYHYESANEPYPASPLMKGRPIQIAATNMINRAMDSAFLKVQPPVGYDRSDTYFAQQGGPAIFPGALWGTLEQIKAHVEVGGDPSALTAAFGAFVSFYGELTGVLPARLGAQTVSHTTAFAKDAELQRGAVRTVDYVRASGKGPITRWLGMSYQMGRDALEANKSVSFHIDSYGGYVEITKAHLPERANFEWFGSGGPAEEQQKNQAMMSSAQMAVQLDLFNVQTGNKPNINIGAMQRELLRKGHWTDLDVIMNTQTTIAPPAPIASLPGILSAAAA